MNNMNVFTKNEESRSISPTNRVEIIIKTGSPAEQKKIGSNICEQLRGDPDFINSNIVVNYTDSDNNVYVIASKEAKPVVLQLNV